MMRTAADHEWCGGADGRSGQLCVERRRAERFGPFKAWGTNNHSPVGG
jgi:hypothetical protein